MYYKSIIERENELLHELIEKPNCNLVKEVKKNLEIVKININDIKNKNKKWIEEKIRIWDESMWREDNLRKKTLYIYNQFKNEIKEKTYYNESASLFMFKLRSNTLKLNDRNRFTDGEIKCNLCNAEKEDIEHFILDCSRLGAVRIKILKLQYPREESREKIIGELLFDENCNEEKNLYEMWITRKILVEDT